MAESEILQKIAKLLRKAKDDSISAEEAAVFMAGVQKLLQKYNLELSQVPDAKDKPNYISRDLPMPVRRRWASSLIGAVAEFNWCKAVSTNEGKLIVLVGTEVNIEAVVMIFESLMALLPHLAATAYLQHKVYCKLTHTIPLTGVRYRIDFHVGAVSAITERLKEQQKAFEAEGNESMALVALAEKELTEAYRKRFAGQNLRKHGPLQYYSRSAFGDGVEAGNKVPLNRGIQGE